MSRAAELAEEIKVIIQETYDAEGIQTFADFEAYFVEACDVTGIIDDNRLRGAIRQIVQAQSSVFRALKQREKEIHRPITKDSPTDHLPISNRIYSALSRSRIRKVGDILNILSAKGREGLVHPEHGIKNIGERSADEIYDALQWGGIEIPVQPEGQSEQEEEDAKNIEEIERAVQRIREIVSRGGARQIRKISLEAGETFETGIDLEYLEDSERMIVFYYQRKKLAIEARRIIIKAEG